MSTSSSATQQRPVATAMDIAKCMVKIANENQVQLDVDENGNPIFEGITPLKLQKLIYFAQAASLVLNKKPLFNEPIEAWEYGPVIREVYDAFKQHKRDPIPTDKNFEVDKETEEFLMEVWKAFGKFSASQLVSISHSKPWKNAYDAKRNIDLGEMEEFYTPIFSKTQDGQALAA